jgi:hypothetical protein
MFLGETNQSLARYYPVTYQLIKARVTKPYSAMTGGASLSATHATTETILCNN